MSLEGILNCFPKYNSWEAFKWHMHWVRGIEYGMYIATELLKTTLMFFQCREVPLETFGAWVLALCPYTMLKYAT